MSALKYRRSVNGFILFERVAVVILLTRDRTAYDSIEIISRTRLINRRSVFERVAKIFGTQKTNIFYRAYFPQVVRSRDFRFSFRRRLGLLLSAYLHERSRGLFRRFPFAG